MGGRGDRVDLDQPSTTSITRTDDRGSHVSSPLDRSVVEGTGPRPRRSGRGDLACVGNKTPEETSLGKSGRSLPTSYLEST